MWILSLVALCRPAMSLYNLRAASHSQRPVLSVHIMHSRPRPVLQPKAEVFHPL